MALGTALFALKQAKGASDQYLQARYDEARPILIVINDSRAIVHTQREHLEPRPIWLEWDVKTQPARVLNIGKGAAFNVRSVIYAPESITMHDVAGHPRAETGYSDRYWYFWQARTIMVNEPPVVEPLVILEHEQETAGFDKHIQGKDIHKKAKQYSLNAGPHPLEVGSPKAAPICRITLTYSGISGRRYASIFDCFHNIGWVQVDFLEDIPRDLADLHKE